MSPALATAVIGGLLVLAVIVGVIWRFRDGRRKDGGDRRFDAADAGRATFGSTATLVQFSTEMCTRCPGVRRLLSSLAAEHPGVEHIDIDLTHRTDLSSRYRVLQTPTTFLVDPTGTVRARFNGVPRRDALTEALAAVQGSTHRSTP